MTTSPQEIAEVVDVAPRLRSALLERHNVYAVMGLPFTSGHVLAMRRIGESKVGPAYTSVWHRDEKRRWRFYANADPYASCPRYFGAAATEIIQTDVVRRWITPYRLELAIPAIQFEWSIELAETRGTRLLNGMGRLLPDAAWRHTAVLAAMGLLAGPILGAGRLGLQGRVPNGQRFIAIPRTIWSVVRSAARMAGEDLGAPAPVTPQAKLGDFWIPQRGIFAVGETAFDGFDPAQHAPPQAGAVESVRAIVGGRPPSIPSSGDSTSQ